MYNVRQYVGRCLSSIANQTFSDFEVICVDDCSSDDSSGVVSDFQRYDKRIKLIRHDVNQGPGGARNTAIKAARGRYIAGVDSDDTIKSHMLERLLEASNGGEFDLVCCSFDSVDETGALIQSFQGFDEKIDVNSNFDILNRINPAIWNKLWRRSIFIDNNIKFPNNVYYQDAATTPVFLSYSKKIRRIKDSLYNYTQRPDNITGGMSDKHMVDYFRVFDIILKFLRNNGLWSAQKANFIRFVDQNIHYHASNVVQKKEGEEARQYISNLYAFKVGYISVCESLDNYGVSEILKKLSDSESYPVTGG